MLKVQENRRKREKQALEGRNEKGGEPNCRFTIPLDGVAGKYAFNRTWKRDETAFLLGPQTIASERVQIE